MRDPQRQFVQEAQAASTLNRPHIVTIHEIDSANGVDFIVREYVRGKIASTRRSSDSRERFRRRNTRRASWRGKSSRETASRKEAFW
jgi:aminoglycoside phosphotransferase (APT) family kinase protein